ncbi:MAG: DUF4399 domain-containing protein [Marinobacter sp.]|uniref:DUF4399 domain-containing protein n=1 Tax=Marinobacter sp. TaxID=50741 RepID=UPI00299EFA00|nr:DUF4399 domain-containing protein [Marinobacter sp.]MDX1756098.1 DUF4399 domain-containing protein [Marinobacter sp.]
MPRSLAAVTLSALLAVPLSGQATPAPEDAETRILSPQDGATVSAPFTVTFGLSGMGVAPAGVEREKTGHHHLLVDVDHLPPGDQPIPSDDHHRHFGGGQTEVMLDLPPGEHTLQLLLGDHMHVPHTPPVVSDKITVTVSE